MLLRFRLSSWLPVSSGSASLATSATVSPGSSPRRIKPTVRISRSELSCLLRDKVYGACGAGAAFGMGCRPTR